MYTLESSCSISKRTEHTFINFENSIVCKYICVIHVYVNISATCFYPLKLHYEDFASLEQADHTIYTLILLKSH